MTEPGLLGYVVFGAGTTAVLVILFAGLSRIPWRYAFEIGVGSGAIVGLGTIASNAVVPPFDQGQVVAIAAILGGLVVRAYERGLAQRRAEIDRILAIPGSPQT